MRLSLFGLRQKQVIPPPSLRENHGDVARTLAPPAPALRALQAPSPCSVPSSSVELGAQPSIRIVYEGQQDVIERPRAEWGPHSPSPGVPYSWCPP